MARTIHKLIVSFALILKGITSIFAQVLLLRELLIIFSGNELIIGLAIAIWLIVQALGSGLLFKLINKIKNSISAYCIIQVLIAIYLPISIIIARLSAHIFKFTSGEAIGMLKCFFLSFLILLPIGCMDGILFPLGAKIFSFINSKDQTSSVGKAYGFEALGFFIGGPLITFLFLPLVNAIKCALFISFLNTLSCFLLSLAKSYKRKPLLAFYAIPLALTILSLFINLDKKIHAASIKLQWEPCELVEYKNSVYGNIVLVKKDDQYTLFTDGTPLINLPVPDIASLEEFAHFSILSHGNPKSILVINSGAGGLIKELLKYPSVQNIDYSELDPMIIKTLKTIPSSILKEEFSDKRLSIINTDARKFIRTAVKKYDIIMLNSSLPTTLASNRLFTKEFFGKTSRILKRNGLFTLKIPGTTSYYDEYIGNINLCIINTLKSVFSSVLIIPGETNIIIASNSDIDINNILPRYKLYKVETKTLSEDYIQYRLSSSWTEWLKNSLTYKGETRQNHDFRPSLLIYSLQFVNAKLSPLFAKIMKNGNFILWLLAIIVLIFPLISLSKKAYIIFCISTSSFTAMAASILLIMSFQISIGLLYGKIGLLISSFMIGIFSGTLCITKTLEKTADELSLMKLAEFCFPFILLIMLISIHLIKDSPSIFTECIFFSLSLLAGFMIGVEFPLANKLYGGNGTFGTLYSIDLLAATLASLMISLIFIPTLGITLTIFILIALKIISLILILSYK